MFAMKKYPLGGPNAKQYEAVRDQIELGDILLYQGKGFVSQEIVKLTDGDYSHCGMPAWWHRPDRAPGERGDRTNRTCPRLVVLEATWPRVAVRPTRLSIAQYPGAVDWWQLKPELRKSLNMESLFEAAMDGIGKHFSIGGLFRYLWRLVTKAQCFYDEPTSAYFCSQYVSTCFTAGGLDPSIKASSFTSPTDLARSGLWDYRETISKTPQA